MQVRGSTCCTVSEFIACVGIAAVAGAGGGRMQSCIAAKRGGLASAGKTGSSQCQWRHSRGRRYANACGADMEAPFWEAGKLWTSRWSAPYATSAAWQGPQGRGADCTCPVARLCGRKVGRIGTTGKGPSRSQTSRRLDVRRDEQAPWMWGVAAGVTTFEGKC